MVKEIKKIKAQIIKQQKNLKDKVTNFFDWVKGAKLIELNECDTSEDPVRPELDNAFRSSYGSL